MTDLKIVLEESLHRVVPHDDRWITLLEAFYKDFMASTPIVAEKFAGTDMRRQLSMLRSSLQVMLTFATSKQVLIGMDEVARAHDRRHQDISPDLYDKWLESLITVLGRQDPLWCREVELSWRVHLAPGIAYMKFLYDHPED